MEEGLAKRLVQIGIRTLNRHQSEQAEKFGVEMVPMSALPAFDRVKIRGRFIFLSTWTFLIRRLHRGFRTMSREE
jgi:hypothetical protein